MSSVHGGKIVWCLLSTVAKKCGVFCSPWQKGVVSFVHPGKKCLVSFGSGVFCPAPGVNTGKSAPFIPFVFPNCKNLCLPNINNKIVHTLNNYCFQQTNRPINVTGLCPPIDALIDRR